MSIFDDAFNNFPGTVGVPKIDDRFVPKQFPPASGDDPPPGPVKLTGQTILGYDPDPSSPSVAPPSSGLAGASTSPDNSSPTQTYGSSGTASATGGGWGDVISSYFMRAIVIIVGMIFVAAGLKMFAPERVVEAIRR